jgi:hypothetical protein
MLKTLLQHPKYTNLLPPKARSPEHDTPHDAFSPWPTTWRSQERSSPAMSQCERAGRGRMTSCDDRDALPAMTGILRSKEGGACVVPAPPQRGGHQHGENRPPLLHRVLHHRRERAESGTCSIHHHCCSWTRIVTPQVFNYLA